MEEDDANSAKNNFSDSDGSDSVKPGKEDAISTGIKNLSIKDHQEERRGESVAEQPIQEAGYDDGDENEDGFVEGIDNMNIAQPQQEMATPPHSSSSSSSCSPCSSLQTTSVQERKRKGMAEKPIQEDDSDQLTDVEESDIRVPFLTSNKRSCRRKILYPEDDDSIGLESKIESSKKTQLSISSHCALGENAPASVAPDLVEDQGSVNQVEKDQDQESTNFSYF